MPQRLPLIPGEPHYRFSTELSGIPFVVEVRWNQREEAWYMTVLDANESPVLSGVKLVLGALLGARSADPRKPPGAFVVADLSGTGRDATLDDLGTRVVVSFFSNEELAT